MIKPITEKEWIGLDLNDASKKAKSIDYDWRIVEEDGISHILTMDFRSNRVNLRLRHNKVIGVYTG
jgi:hypothetical protein